MTSPASDTITVNGDRLRQSLMDLAEIGAYDHERTGLRGVTRRSPVGGPVTGHNACC
jgi:N-carbamoyl-L-amino-acid hydrolase